MNPGDLAPDFALDDQNGVERRLSGLVGAGPVVLFFYPWAHTRGCTREACRFRDLAVEFAALGATRVGVSMDGVERQRSFAAAHGFDFSLLSDADGEVARLYGVERSWDRLKVRRTTFVIGADRRVIEVIASEIDMNAHADRALAALAALAR